MSILKSLFANKGGVKSSDSPETGPVKMNLEERMAFRREMLYEAIKVTMQGAGYLQGSYRFRVVRNDQRGHRYSVMLDLSPDYLNNSQGEHAQLMTVGATLTENAMDRYGIMVSGVYWRITEEIQGFDRVAPRPAGDARDSEPASAAPESVPGGASDSASRRAKFERATADELAAFEEAWKKGQSLRVGDRVYSSDLMPLSGDDDKN